jgi:hypothetical protein
MWWLKILGVFWILCGVTLLIIESIGYSLATGICGGGVCGHTLAVFEYFLIGYGILFIYCGVMTFGTKLNNMSRKQRVCILAPLIPLLHILGVIAWLFWDMYVNVPQTKILPPLTLLRLIDIV